MNCYEIRLIPEAGFATPLKGDTVFGHFCWQAAHDPDLIDGGLDRAMERYGEDPSRSSHQPFRFSPKLGRPTS